MIWMLWRCRFTSRSAGLLHRGVTLEGLHRISMTERRQL
jgi:hypothetical protein